MPNNHSKPLRVLHYLDAVREEAGGVVRCVVDLCCLLARQGVDVTLATLDPKDIPTDWSDGPDTPRVIDMRRDGLDIGAAVASVDVVHLHTPWDRNNVRFARWSRKQRVPYIVSVHGMLDDWCMNQKRLKKSIYVWLRGRRLLENAHRVHCTAEGEVQQAAKWYPLGKSVVLPLVVDLPASGSLPGPELAQSMYPALNTSNPKVLFLSRLHPKKGVDHLLHGAAQVLDRGIALELIIAGPGETAYVEELHRLANQLGIADRTHFVGLVQGEAKLSLYQACDLFALPTHQENFGLVLAEAMACGTPVVTTRGVDIWPEIEAGGGVIVDNRADSLADAVARLLDDRQALSERGGRGRRYVNEWLNPECVVKGYIELYREAARTR